MIINLEIDVTKLDKSKIKEVTLKNGKVAKYLKLTLLENRNGTDQYHNDGMVFQSTTKEERANNQRGEILGNFRIAEMRNGPPARAARDTGTPGVPPPPVSDPTDPESDDIPF